MGKVFSGEELERIGALAVKHNLIILSDEVYDRLYYVPFTRIATLSPELYERTLTVGSAGKAFYATGWRVGYLIGPPHLIKYVAAAHTRICYSSVSPLQEASAVAFEKADAVGFWDQSRTEMRQKVELFCKVFDELEIPVSFVPTLSLSPFFVFLLFFSAIPDWSLQICSTPIRKAATLSSPTCHPSSCPKTTRFLHTWPAAPAISNCPGS